MTILLVPNLKIYHVLHQTSTFQHQDCKYNNCSLKQPNIAFLVPSGRILILLETFELDKLKDVDYKYDNRFLTFQPKDRSRAFLVTNLFFCFGWNFIEFHKFEGADLKFDVEKRILVRSLTFFCFCMKLCKLINLRMLIFNTALVF